MSEDTTQPTYMGMDVSQWFVFIGLWVVALGIIALYNLALVTNIFFFDTLKTYK
jgi:hypothetical protein